MVVHGCSRVNSVYVKLVPAVVHRGAVHSKNMVAKEFLTGRGVSTGQVKVTDEGIHAREDLRIMRFQLFSFVTICVCIFYHAFNRATASTKPEWTRSDLSSPSPRAFFLDAFRTTQRKTH